MQTTFGKRRAAGFFAYAQVWIRVVEDNCLGLIHLQFTDIHFYILLLILTVSLK